MLLSIHYKALFKQIEENEKEAEERAKEEKKWNEMVSM